MSPWTPAACLGFGTLAIIFGWGNPAVMVCGTFLVLLGLALDADRFWSRSVQAGGKLRRRR